jgi:hypothetical protein
MISGVYSVRSQGELSLVAKANKLLFQADIHNSVATNLKYKKDRLKIIIDSYIYIDA